MKKDNVLIFPAGTEIAFEIFNALKYSKFVNLYGGASIEDHSLMLYKNIIKGFPFVDDENFITFINNVVHEYKIDFIYPAHDSVVVKLTENKDLIDAQIITTDEATVNICRSKEKTYMYLANENFIPEIYNINNKLEFPLFLKPKIGQGSKGARIINSKQELDIYYSNNDILCEYLPGKEITVDCFTDLKGILKVISPRERLRIKNGIAVKTKNLILTDEIKYIAETLNKKLEFKGAWFFQLKCDVNNQYKLLEVSPRIPGTMGLSRNKGINFPLLSIYANKGIDCVTIENSYDIVLDRAFINRYKIDIFYTKIYVDLDDTLIINDKINLVLIAFLYQCINKNKKIYLLTKHKKKIEETLTRHRISLDLFDGIYHLRTDEKKYNYIEGRDCIFIDDSFAERFEVKKKLNINVFDVDMVECLLDWRK